MTIPCSPSFRHGCLFYLTAVLLLPPVGTLHGQDAGRIWGRIGVVGGEVFEGFIRWDRNEASWVDVLDGSKSLSWEAVREWTADPELELTSKDRVVEYGGYRITWDDSEADFPLTAGSGIRMGHLQRIQITGDQEVEVVLRSGAAVTMDEAPITMNPSPGVTVILSGGSTDLGHDLREVQVDIPGGDVVKLGWEDLEWVAFGPPPEGASPSSSRLFGTVEDRLGRRFAGAIAWNADEALVTDTLNGEDEAGEDHEIPYSTIASLSPSSDGSEVVLVSGERLRLSHSRDVDDDNQGIRISDPRLGGVEVEWDDLASVQFHPPDAEELRWMGLGAFDGGHRLRGTVVTFNGDELTGWIRWDADEEYSWEFLDGEDQAATYDIEFGNIASIHRLGSREARVTLLDGRVLDLRGSNDVTDDNKGILVQTEELEAAEDPEAPRWIRVRWDDFEIVHFHH